MVARLRLWLQPIKQHWVTIGGSALVVVVVITLIIVGYRLDWTGFARKTLWDWLMLLASLAIPVVVGFGAAWFTRTWQLRDQERERLQRDRDQQLADQRAELERKAAEQRAELERELTRDNQHETLLQTYIDRMSELLEKRLRESQPEDEVRTIARTRTLTVLSRLDNVRRSSVLQFLSESGLISKGTYIINLRGADFSNVHLKGANLRGAPLSEVDLSEVDLSGADLSGASLRGANLSEANLRGANLSKADLTQALLNSANLSGANLTGVSAGRWIQELPSKTRIPKTDLSGADLSGADLSDAYLPGVNLCGANLSEATLIRTTLGSANLSRTSYWQYC